MSSAKPSAVTPSPSLYPLTPTRQRHSSGFQLSKSRCRVHPAVILSMLHAHNRISGANGFAIGTLLGVVSADGSKGASGVLVEIIDCFANPFHSDRMTTALTIQKDPHEWMLKLREKVNPKLSVVGWFCTTNTISYTTALSDWATSEQKVSRFVPSKIFPEPIFLVLDPSFTTYPDMLSAAKAYIRGPLRQLFHDIHLEICLHPADIPGTAAIIKNSTYFGKSTQSLTMDDGSLAPKYLNSFEGSLNSALNKLQSILNYTLKYLDAVLADRVDPDTDIGRQLMRAVSYTIPESKAESESRMKSSTEDNLMIASLMNLTKLQFALAEKLNSYLV